MLQEVMVIETFFNKIMYKDGSANPIPLSNFFSS